MGIQGDVAKQRDSVSVHQPELPHGWQHQRKHGNQIVAFRTGEPVTLEYLNAYARPENRVDVNKPFRPSKITRAAAREAYPEWYERVIVKGEKYPKMGHCRKGTWRRSVCTLPLVAAADIINPGRTPVFLFDVYGNLRL